MHVSLPSLTPWITLIGTLAVASLGFYQWRKQYSNANRAANAAARREAYEGLWKKLEQINLDLRNDTNPSLFRRLHEVNVYFLSNSLHFEDDDQPLINDYVAALDKLREKIYTAGDSDVVSAFRMTAALPPRRDSEIESAAARVEQLRAKIKKKVQRVAGSS